jgi:hypothetical protein
MSMTTVAYARRAYKSFSRSARHLVQLIASHQSLQTGWAYLSYSCLAEESSLTPRRVIQLVAFLELHHAIEVRRGHGRGHVNFYRVLDEQTGKPVPCRPSEKVKFAPAHSGKKVKFSTPSAAENVKSEMPNTRQSLKKLDTKVVEIKEREKKEAPPALVSRSPQDGADAPKQEAVTPEQLLRLGLTPGSRFWRQALGEHGYLT